MLRPEFGWFWAKLGQATWPETYHPAACHLIDVARVALALWERTIRPQLRDWVAGRLGVPADAAGRWLAFWAGAHDVGKIASGFQDVRDRRTAALRGRLAAAGYYPPEGGRKRHDTVGTQVLVDLLPGVGPVGHLPPPFFRDEAVAVGGQHGVFPAAWDEVHADLGGPRWDAARRAVLGDMARLLGVPAPAPPPADDRAVWMVLAGLTAMADWVVSNATFFPPAGPPATADLPLDTDGCSAAGDGTSTDKARLHSRRSNGRRAPRRFARGNRPGLPGGR